jgi:hypothetical protein
MTYDLAGQQGVSEPEQEQPAEDEQHGSGFARALGDVFGGPSTFQLRAPPLQQGQLGGSLGSAPRANPISVPYEQRSAEISQHNATQQAAFHGPSAGRQSTIGRSAQDVSRQYGSPGQTQ